MSITSEIEIIKSKKRGEDVRDALVSAMQKLSESTTLVKKNISSNGAYKATNDSADGYSEVNVNVEPLTGEKRITANGTYNSSDDSLDGYSSVVVDVTGSADVKLSEKEITKNGIYTAEEAGVNGFSKVIVNVSGGDFPIPYSKTVTDASVETIISVNARQ